MKITSHKNRSAASSSPLPFVSFLCQERAIDCGYAALASAIEGKAWERRRYLNLMRRLSAFKQQLGSF